MKTRFFFLLLAAVLLGSMSAFAQNDNGEPLKGDVNGDDVVDVADVVAVLQIMKEGEGIGERHYYVSIGTTPVTASNFKVVNNATQVVASSYESQYEFTPSGTDYVYVLVADDYWVSTITNQSSNTPVDFSIVTDVEISGYTVYKTNNKVSGKILVNIEHVIYYWYVGQTDPATMTNISPITTDYEHGGGWFELGTTVPETIQQLVKGGDSTKYWYVAVPITSGTTLKPVSSDMTTLDTSVTAQSIKTFNNVNYQIYWYGGATASRNTFRFANK